jgi:hypothetical protein
MGGPPPSPYMPGRFSRATFTALSFPTISVRHTRSLLLSHEICGIGANCRERPHTQYSIRSTDFKVVS